MKTKIGWWGPSCTGLGQGLMVIFLQKRMTKIVQMDFIWRGSGHCSDRQTMDLFPLIRWVPHTQPPTGRALQFPSMTDSHRKQMTDKNMSQIGRNWDIAWVILTRTWVRTILISGAPARLIDRAGDGSTFREIRQLATWILWSLKSAASFILRDGKERRDT